MQAATGQCVDSTLFMGATAPITLLHTAATPIGRVLSRFDRSQIESFIAVAIELLDAIDGDHEAEDGDEDCCAAYDDHVGWSLAGLSLENGPGDPEDGEIDDPAEEAWPGDFPDYGINQDQGHG